MTENKSLQMAIEAIRADERERCAKIADARASAWLKEGLMVKFNEASSLAAEIRGFSSKGDQR